MRASFPGTILFTSAFPDLSCTIPYVSHEMTIRDLLTHRSGMGLGEGDLLFWPHTTYSREDVIYRLRFMKPQSSFRSHYAYDNLLYMTAGQIIPAVTGTTWDDYVRQRIFAPLGMNHTDLSTTAYKPGGDYAYPAFARGWKAAGDPFRRPGQCRSGRRYQFCAADMAKWVQLQLNRGKIRGSWRTVVQRAAIERDVVPADDSAHRRSACAFGRPESELRRLRAGLGIARLSRPQVGRAHRRRGRLRLASDAGAGGKSRSSGVDECGRGRSFRLHPLSCARLLLPPAVDRLDCGIQSGERSGGKRGRRNHEEGRRRSRRQFQAFPPPREICRRL